MSALTGHARPLPHKLLYKSIALQSADGLKAISRPAMKGRLGVAHPICVDRFG